MLFEFKDKFKISDLCSVAVCAHQGRASSMEDNFKIITNIKDSQISIFAVADGHGGDFCSQYCADVIVPDLGEKISALLDLLKGESSEEDPLTEYITAERKINYELLLRNEIIAGDQVLVERLKNATLFCGSTLCIVIVDLPNTLVICANIGDSRAILCDHERKVIELSHDHKANRPGELERITANGGTVKKQEGCYRVEGLLAVSRSLGDFPFKQRKLIIAEPEIIKFNFKLNKYIPKYIIIATDGLWDVVNNTEACNYVKSKITEFHFGAKSLVRKSMDRKTLDNITVIIVKFTKPKVVKKRSSFDPFSGTYEWLR